VNLETMSENLILKSKKPSLKIPLKSVGEVLWKKLQELNDETTCFVSNKHFSYSKNRFFMNLCLTLRLKQKVAQK
jgi:hypothetical protein